MEKYIGSAIDSVLSQTYKDIELIIVNDDSTDLSEEIILSKKTEIETTLSAFKYIKQDNTGVAGACQTGFKNATGRYLILLDGDDYLFPSSIEKQKDFLEKNQDYAAVRTNGYYTYPEENEKRYLLEFNPETGNETEVWKKIFFGQVHAFPGGYMMRMSVLDEIYQNRDIYTSRYGQNLQFLLVTSYHRKVGFIDEPLLKYYIRKDSMTHRIEKDQKNREIGFLEGFKDIRKYIVDNYFDEEDKQEFLKKNDLLYARMYLQVAAKYGDVNLANENYEKIKMLTDNQISKSDKRLFYSIKYPVYKFFMRPINKIRRILKFKNQKKS